MTVRNRGALAAVAAGAAALTVATVVACGSRPAADVGGADVERLATATPPPAGAPAATRVPVTSGDLPTAAGTVPPTRLRIPAIGVAATVDAVGIDERTDEFDVPPSVDQVGWYRYGPGLEADAGSIVVAGHVDSATQGRGAFYRLRELDRGDTVTVTGSDGRERAYRVVAREEYDKTKIPLDRYFARDGSVRLTLITCGGPFDAEARRYRDNIVITAVPA
ncbi:class F sortase [Micromonospora sp. NBRC 101691]|uniref:class F sortase n=1 Tax=Micromonospora sp. NBRC 101691 TaxID=3032198 RepID=UPI0024A592AC|nr:class F sortase [Micromonospora sp. NBRC 101691]GLY24500.1 class F sortase [Micromonospora sp. NBRC 101691]